MSDFPLIDWADDQGIASRNENYHNKVEASASQRRVAILGEIIRAGSYGCTLDELATLYDCPPNQISGRVSELKRLGLVVHTEQRRKTRTGSSASVIVAVNAGGVQQ